jgi:hypothetical protein
VADEQPRLDVVGDVEWPGGRNPFEYTEPGTEEEPTAAVTPDQPDATAEPQPDETPQPAAPPEAQPPETATPAEPDPGADQPAAEAPAEPEVEVPDNDPFASLRDDKGLILGKYKTVEDWAAGHRQAEGWATQQSQARAQAEREAAQAREILTQLQPYMPLIQQAMQNPAALQGQPQPPAVQVPEDLDLSDPQQLTTFLAQRDAQIRQQLQTELQQTMSQQFQTQQQQMTSQQAHAAQMAAVQRFRQAHPDAEPGSSIDMGVAHIFEEYRPHAEEFRSYTEENLEIAYTLVRNPQVKEMIDRFDLVPNRDAIARATEMVADPNLANYVAANPSALTDTDDQGWEYAKQLAALPALLQGAANGAQLNTQQQQQQARAMAHLEAGGSGAPVQAAPGERPKNGNDVFLETVVKPWKEQTSAFLPTRGTS